MESGGDPKRRFGPNWSVPTEKTLAKIGASHGFWYVPDGSMVTMDYREDRVRVFVDDTMGTSPPPCIG
jgi:hypothetical protein